MTTDITLGAWVFGGGTYHYVRGDRMGEVPSPDLSDYDAVRVNLAVRAIQRQLDVTGFSPHRYDGVFGFFTRTAVKGFQKERLLPYTNGAVGRTTMGELLRPLVRRLSDHLDVPKEPLAGIPIHEAGWDPAAVGASTPIELGVDRGLFQINSLSHPDVSDAQAFDAVFNLNWGADALRDRHARYVAKAGDPKAWDCAVLANLSPVAADAWAFDGQEPTALQLQYVADVRSYGRTYWAM